MTESFAPAAAGDPAKRPATDERKLGRSLAGGAFVVLLIVGWVVAFLPGSAKLPPGALGRTWTHAVWEFGYQSITPLGDRDRDGIPEFAVYSSGRRVVPHIGSEIFDGFARSEQALEWGSCGFALDTPSPELAVDETLVFVSGFELGLLRLDGLRPPPIPAPRRCLPSEIVPVGDVDADGVVDIVLASPSGQGAIELRCTSLNGRVVWSVDGGGRPFCSMARTIDVDRDGHEDVAVRTEPGRMRAMSATTGCELRAWSIAAPTSHGVDVADVGDLDGDGERDLAIALGSTVEIRSLRDDRCLYVLRSVTPHRYEKDAFSTAGDVDADGTPDLLWNEAVEQGTRATLFSGRSGARLAAIDIRHGMPHPFALPEIVAGIGDADHDGQGDVAVLRPVFDERSGFALGQWLVRPRSRLTVYSGAYLLSGGAVDE